MNGTWICQGCLTLDDGEALELHIQAHARAVPWSYDEVSQAIRELRGLAYHCDECRTQLIGDIGVVPTVRFSDHTPAPAWDVNLPGGRVAHFTLNLPRRQGREALLTAVANFGAAMQRAVDLFNMAFTPEARRVAEQLRDAGLLPDEGPTDPKARALWAVKNRNTGPARPSGQNARRPRRSE